MVSERCHLQRSNHQAEMMSSFTKLLLNESLVDVTLACEGVRLKAHRIVLSACSPYFQEIFEDNPCQHPVVILKGVRFSDLKSIIDFVYQGEVDIKPQNLNCFLKTAKTLQISGLPNCENDITLQNGHLRNDNIPKPQSVINSVSPSMQLSPSLKDTQKSVQSRSVRSVDDKDVNNKGVARDNLETSSPVHLLSFLKTESVEEVVDNDEVNASENNQASFIESVS